MVSVDDMQRFLFSGGDVVGPDGKKIGSFGQLFLDAATGEPAWATVSTGMFGSSESFVPLTGARVHDDVLEVAYDKGQVKHAPRIDGSDGALSPDEERDLYRHYGLLHDDVPDDAGPAVDRTDDRVADDGVAPVVVPPPIRPIGTPAPPLGAPALAPPGTPSATEGSVDVGSGAHALVPGAAGAPDRDGTDEDARPTDSATAAATPPPQRESAAAGADDGMIARAEHAKVIGTERVPTERVRMRRYTVTEQREITVPVTREEVRVEYEPAEGGAPLPAPDDAATPQRPDPDGPPASDAPRSGA